MNGEETKETMKMFLDEEWRQIEIHKWIESEHAKYDKSQETINDWIEKYGPEFRKSFINNLINEIEKDIQSPDRYYERIEKCLKRLRIIKAFFE